jgi:two-component system cell cycle sensor histidine kinase/response regulator CckA
MNSNAKSPGAPGSPENTAAAGNQPARATLLLAEDDAAVRGFLQALLEQAGYQVLAAGNGRQALALCTDYAGVIHALITDVVMPETNGRELAERACSIRPDLKVVVVSGYVDRGLKQKDSPHPRFAFLQKPFTEESLFEVLADLQIPFPAPKAELVHA